MYQHLPSRAPRTVLSAAPGSISPAHPAPKARSVLGQDPCSLNCGSPGQHLLVELGPWSSVQDSALAWADEAEVRGCEVSRAPQSQVEAWGLHLLSEPLLPTLGGGRSRVGGAGDPVPELAGVLREVTMPLRAGETSLRCAQDGPGPRTSPPPGKLFWPLCEWKAPTGDSVQPSSFSVSPPCPHTPGSRKHMFAQNLGLRRRSTGSGPGGLGLRLHLPVARVTWGLLLCPLSGTWIWARL